MNEFVKRPDETDLQFLQRVQDKLDDDRARLLFDVEVTPLHAHYHTVAFANATKKLESHPPDWLDGNPKRCPGSGMAPGVQFYGEVGTEDEEPRYLCRCPWCDRPHTPGLMPEHTFFPVRGAGSFALGDVLEGIEPLPRCDGNHALPRCLDPMCWRDTDP